MATYYVWNGATGANNGSSWTNAYVSFGSAVTAATLSGDLIKVHYAHVESLTVDTTYTFQNHVIVLCCDKDYYDYPANMGWDVPPSYYIGHSTSNRSITFAGAYRIYIFGLTFRISGSTADNFQLINTNNQHITFINCVFWMSNSSSTSRINLGTANEQSGYIHLLGCTFRFGNASQSIVLGDAKVLMQACGIPDDGTNVSTLFTATEQGPKAEIIMFNTETNEHATGILVGDCSQGARRIFFNDCRFYPLSSIIATQTVTNCGSAEVSAMWCINSFPTTSDEGLGKKLIDKSNAFGRCSTIDSANMAIIDPPYRWNNGAYGDTAYNGGVNYVWRVVTTANASIIAPFFTPWIVFDATSLSTTTYKINILRDDSTTPLTNAEIWIEILYQNNTNYPLIGINKNWWNFTGSPANISDGVLDDWTNVSGTNWAGVLSTGSIPISVRGFMQIRIAVAKPSITVYIDPKITL